MSNISQQIFKGKLLIAAPAILTDKSFNRSVILLTEHNEEGSVGFILNKPTKYTVGDLVKNFNCEFPVYIGGPVETDNLYFIHRIPELIPGSNEIISGLYWGGDYEVVKALVEKQIINHSDIRFFIGYSGWSPDQLEDEIADETWVLIDNDFPDIFKIRDASQWREKLLQLGGDYSLWANSPDDPILN